MAGKPIIWRFLIPPRPIFLITLLAALLRVAFISQPAIWGDEALTYSRVCGTYRQLIDILQRDGFVPLHYEIYWLIARVFRLTPVVIRIVPIVSGILFVPAMYFLARQLVSRRTAELVALFTACSAYMLVYSRDAKMYPHFWLFAALMMAFYLWWLREPRRVLWLAWITCGVAATGLHAAGFFLVALLPIFLITDRKAHWKKTVCMLIGLAIISAGPVGYFMKFNRLVERSEEENFNEASGTQWVKPYNAGRDGPSHVMYCTTAFLFGWEKPVARDEPAVRPDRLYWYTAATWAVLGALALGAFPRRRRDGRACEFDCNAPPSVSSPKPFWLAVWLILPVYAFYCRSVDGFVSPWDWVRTFADVFSHRWIGMVGCVVAAIFVLEIFWTTRTPQFPSPGTPGEGQGGGFPACKWRGHKTAALLTLIVLTLQLFILPRQTPMADRFLASMFAVIPSIAFHNSAKTTARRLTALAIFLASVALVMVLCQIVYSISDKELIGSLWVPRYIAVVWPAFAIIVAILIGRLPTRAMRWGVIGLLLILNADRFVQRIMGNFNVDDTGKVIVTGSEPPIDQVARDVVDSDTIRRETIGQRTVLWHARSTTRTYVFFERPGIASPGAGDILSTPGRYYLTVLGDVDLTPQQFRTMSPFEAGFFQINQNTDPRTIAADVARNPNLTKVIVWDRTNSNAQSTADLQLRLLGSKWTLAGTETFEVSQHWMDMDLGVYRRREYVRK